MAEAKPGLLRRIFSFGRGIEAEPAAQAEEAGRPAESAAAGPAPIKPAIPAGPRAVEAPGAPSARPRPAASQAPKRANALPSGKAEGVPARPEPAAAAPARTGKVTLFEPAAPGAPAPQPAGGTGWFDRLKKGLARSSNALTENLAAVFVRRRLDDDALQELEDLLIRADLGIDTAMRITEALSARRYGRDVTDAEVRQVMAAEIEKVLAPVARPLELDLGHRPHVVLVVGVNGSGKTTTIGKIAAKLKAAGLSTLLVAGDTFRAAAIEQLQIWGERTGSTVVAGQPGADAAGLAFDAWRRARDEGHDVMLMDTAGRLQNKAELMAELEKIVRVLKKHDPAAPHTVLLTLDATTGQNALNQVEIFGRQAGVNGLVMTKLDGTARGGILVAIAARYALPVFFLGVGEGVDDLEPFEAADFARSIAGLEAQPTEQA
ncbi:MAG: hypothetical protein BroJett030_04280 [Alphaproteobacteria bacterium]|nr:MAG: hypothetical protein BroJett030_04280 [Alphaproteobacteria bacterium]